MSLLSYQRNSWVNCQEKIFASELKLLLKKKKVPVDKIISKSGMVSDEVFFWHGLLSVFTCKGS